MGIGVINTQGKNYDIVAKECFTGDKMKEDAFNILKKYGFDDSVLKGVNSIFDLQKNIEAKAKTQSK